MWDKYHHVRCSRNNLSGNPCHRGGLLNIGTCLQCSLRRDELLSCTLSSVMSADLLEQTSMILLENTWFVSSLPFLPCSCAFKLALLLDTPFLKKICLSLPLPFYRDSCLTLNGAFLKTPMHSSGSCQIITSFNFSYTPPHKAISILQMPWIHSNVWIIWIQVKFWNGERCRLQGEGMMITNNNIEQRRCNSDTTTASICTIPQVIFCPTRMAIASWRRGQRVLAIPLHLDTDDAYRSMKRGLKISSLSSSIITLLLYVAFLRHHNIQPWRCRSI